MSGATGMAGHALATFDKAERAPDEFRHGLAAIVSVGAPIPGTAGLAAVFRGTPCGTDQDGLLLVFADLEDAAAFAWVLQRRARQAGGSRPGIGINLGAPDIAADVAFARTLRRRAAPGETLISATSDNHLTARVRAEGANEPEGWRGWVLPAIGLTCFLAYFFGWFYAIYWKLAAFVTTGRYPCWPEWLCR